MQRIKQTMLMRTLVNYCNWTLIFKIIGSWHFFAHFFFFFVALGLCRQLVRTEWNETVSQRLGRFLALGLQPQRPFGHAGISLSHLNAHPFILFKFSQKTTQRTPLPSEDKLQELLWQPVGSLSQTIGLCGGMIICL